MVFNPTSRVQKEIGNTFLFQIFRSFFISDFKVGSIYLLGFKDATMKLLTVENDSSLENLSLDILKWVFLVSTSLPDESILPRNKIIRVCIVDLEGNVFLVNNLK